MLKSAYKPTKRYRKASTGRLGKKRKGGLVSHFQEVKLFEKTAELLSMFFGRWVWNGLKVTLGMTIIILGVRIPAIISAVRMTLHRAPICKRPASSILSWLMAQKLSWQQTWFYISYGCFIRIFYHPRINSPLLRIYYCLLPETLELVEEFLVSVSTSSTEN